MSYNIFRASKWPLVAAVVFAFGILLASAASAPLVSPASVSGSYEVLQDTMIGANARIRMRIHLVNHGSSDLVIQRMTLWDFSHPDMGGTHSSAVAFRAHASLDTTEEFSIRRSDYHLWRRGMRPRLVLEMADRANTPSNTTLVNTKTRAVVRLDRISGKEAK
jgi:hypothetical protein